MAGNWRDVDYNVPAGEAFVKAIRGKVMTCHQNKLQVMNLHLGFKANYAGYGRVGIEPNSITSEKIQVSGGFNPEGTCRKVEDAFHLGNGPVISRGNKHISRVESPGGRHIIKTTTFCVEI